jgi:type IV pilus assembly protein PilO
MAIGGELNTRDGLLVFAAVLFLGAAAAYWYFPHADKKLELQELEARVDRLDATNQRAAADLASGTAADLSAEAEEYSRVLVTLRQLVPEATEVPSLLEQISTASRRAGLELGGIRPLPTIEGPEFDTHRFQIGVVGGYHAIARFLTNIGSLTRVITPVDLKLVDRENIGGSPLRRSGDAALVQADFEVRTFVARSAPQTPR